MNISIICTATLSLWLGALSPLAHDRSFHTAYASEVHTFATIPSGARNIMFKSIETSPIDGSEHEEHIIEVMAWQPRLIKGIRSHDMLIVGRYPAPASQFTVERWSYRPSAGAYWVDRGLSTTVSLGTPVTTPPDVVKLVGGGWSSPSNRPALGPASRRLVYLGTDWSEVRTVCSDPDGRYALIVARAAVGAKLKLYQLSLDITSGTTSPVALFDEDQYPTLVNLDTLYARDVAPCGRVYCGSVAPPSSGPFADHIILQDANNDGTGFVVTEMSDAAYLSHAAVTNPDRSYPFDYLQ